MSRRQHLGEFGIRSNSSKTPSPPPVNRAQDDIVESKATASAPMARKAPTEQTIATALPIFYDYQLEQLARLTQDYLSAQKKSAVILDLMQSFMGDQEAFLKSALSKTPERIVQKYAKPYGIKISLDEVEYIIKSITPECSNEADIVDRILYLAAEIRKGASLDFLIDSSRYGTSTLLNSFTQEYQQLPDLKKQYVSRKMVEVINGLDITDVPNLNNLLVYSQGPKVGRIPRAVVQAILKRINQKPKDYGQMSFFIFNYIEASKSINSNPEKRIKLLTDFTAQYHELLKDDREPLIKLLIEHIKKVPGYNVEHLHSILDFAANKTPDKANHHFPPEILLAISEKIHDHKIAIQHGQILPQLIKLSKTMDMYTTTSINLAIKEFSCHYTPLTKPIQVGILTQFMKTVDQLSSIELLNALPLIYALLDIFGIQEMRDKIQNKIELAEEIAASSKANTQLVYHANSGHMTLFNNQKSHIESTESTLSLPTNSENSL